MNYSQRKYKFGMKRQLAEVLRLHHKFYTCTGILLPELFNLIIKP